MFSIKIKDCVLLIRQFILLRSAFVLSLLLLVFLFVCLFVCLTVCLPGAGRDLSMMRSKKQITNILLKEDH